MSPFVIEKIAFGLGNPDHRRRPVIAEGYVVLDNGRHRVFLRGDGSISFPDQVDPALRRAAAAEFRARALAMLAKEFCARTEAEAAS